MVIKRLRLLVCISEYYPYGSGIANVAYNVVEQLKKMGVNCTVCSPIGPDIQLKSLKGYGRLGLIHYWHKVYEYFKEGAEDYDVVWLHNPLFIRNNPFQKSLITIHITASGVYKRTQQSNYPKLRKIYKNIAARIEEFSLGRLDLKNTPFSAISLQVKDELKSLGVAEDRIRYIPNGVDTEIFKPVEDELKKKMRAEFNIPQNDLVLLSTGSLTITKNPLTLINIYSSIENTYKDTCLAIAGRGPLEERVRRLAEEKGIKVIFLGRIEYREMPDLYACADMYIMTSLYEGLPLTLLEAMSSGLPSIVSNVTSISSMVSDAKAGIVVNIENEHETVQQIVSFLNRDLSYYGTNARDYAIKNLDWKEIAKEYFKEFQEIKDTIGKR